jgi:hypothetical protein
VTLKIYGRNPIAGTAIATWKVHDACDMLDDNNRSANVLRFGRSRRGLWDLIPLLSSAQLQVVGDHAKATQRFIPTKPL